MKILGKGCAVLGMASIVVVSPTSALAQEQAQASDGAGTGAGTSGGIRIGAFRLRPEGEVSFSNDSNVYASAENPRSDSLLRLTPRAVLSTETTRYRANVSGGVTVLRYAKRTGENQTDWNASGMVQAEPLRGNFVRFSYTRSRAHDQRSDPNATLAATSPTPFLTSQAEFGFVRDVGRLKADLNLQRIVIDYRNSSAVDGSTIDNQARDRQQDKAALRLTYKFSPRYAALLNASWDRIDYRLPVDSAGINRDSRGWRISGGIYLSLTELIDGEIFAGVQTRRYSDPGLTPYSSPIYGAALIWSASESVKVRLSADRRLEETIAKGYKQYQITSAELGVDKQLTETFGVTGVLRHASNKYLLLADDGTITRRNDNVFGFDIAAKKSFKHFVLGATYSNNRRSSIVQAGRYARSLFELSVTTKF